MATAAAHFDTAQTDTEIVAAPAAGSSIQVRAVHLSVANGQNAQLKAGSGGSVIFTTEGDANLNLSPSQITVGDNTALVVDSSGAVSVFVEYTTRPV